MLVESNQKIRLVFRTKGNVSSHEIYTEKYVSPQMSNSVDLQNLTFKARKLLVWPSLLICAIIIIQEIEGMPHISKLLEGAHPAITKST